MIWSGTCTWKTLCPKPLENYTLSAFWRSVKPPTEDMVTVFCCYIRPVLEYTCPVWHTSLTEAQTHKIKFVQKRALRIILGRNYTGYDEALKVCITSVTQLSDEIHSLKTLAWKYYTLSSIDTYSHPLRPVLVIDLRDMSGLCTIRCHTERYRKSTIPFLARNLKVWIL